ncbi:hypothetical protein [Gluconobacter sp. OJB]|uniref:hypothetical protein n=1 Tax=Gluconobacter sp. OJB TaxID=3145196 RepID=UPI0031F7D5AB
MSILHTLKRKLRSRRRQQDGVLKTFNEALEQEAQRKISYLAKEIYGLVETKCIWDATPTSAEKRAYEKLSLVEKISLVNGMFARVHELRTWYAPISGLPLHETNEGLQIWITDLQENDAMPKVQHGVAPISEARSASRKPK